MDMTDRRILAGHIKYLRETLGENYVEFAKRLGVSVANVCNFEIATRRPDANTSRLLHEAAVEAKQPKLADYFLERAEAVAEFQRINQKARDAMGGQR